MSKPNLLQRAAKALDVLRGREMEKAAPVAPIATPASQVLPQAQSLDSFLSASFGPGRPIQPVTLGDRIRESEPRSFQYVPNANANIVPRLSYGLMSFWQLKYYGENIPEVTMARRILTDEMRNLAPQIVNAKTGEILVKAEVLTRRDPLTGKLNKIHTGRNLIKKKPELGWLTTYPDGQRNFPTWISRVMYNTLIYDANSLFLRRKNLTGPIQAVRVIDGSTIFCIINDAGEAPAPPTPAYASIIFGQVRQWMTTAQLWYRPRTERIDAPYGLTPIEDALAAIRLLEQMWIFQTAWYTEGNVPESFLIPDDKNSAYWTPEKLLEYQRQMNNRLIANPNERVRWQFLPPGVKVENAKKAQWDEKAYATALEKVALTFGVHPSEIGQAPGAGLGGKGFQDKGEDAHTRLGIGPLTEYIEGFMTDIVREAGENDELAVELVPAGVELDNDTRDARALIMWEKKLKNRNATLAAMDEPEVAGPAGEAYFGEVTLADMEPVEPLAEEKPEDTAPTQKPPTPTAQKPKPEDETNLPLTDNTAFEKLWGIEDLAKHCGVCPEDDSFYQAHVSRVLPVTSPHLGANRSEIVAVRNASDDVRPAMFKPLSGEWDILWDWVGGFQCVREEAIYLLDRALGFYLCPVAFCTDVDGEQGAVILYVRGHPRRSAKEYMPHWIMRAAVLDFIAGQVDRAAHNWLTHPEDEMRPILIDGGLTFPVEAMEARSAFVEAMRGESVPQDVLAAIGAVLDDVVWADIAQLVGADAADAARTRARELYAAQTIPLDEPLTDMRSFRETITLNAIPSLSPR